MAEIPKMFRGRYRIGSKRLKYHDYGQNGAYFITICIRHRERFFGDVVNGEICLSDIGMIAYDIWRNIPKHFQNVSLGEFVIMPDHMHGIIEIDKPLVMNTDGVETCYSAFHDEKEGKETPKLGVCTKQKSCWKSGNIGVIVNQYKRAVTIQSRKINPEFRWQSRFYDRIIRNQHEYNAIADYIRLNPKNWKDDE